MMGRVRGELFHRMLVHVSDRWGKRGMDVIRVDPALYLPESWYPFGDFCDLLARIRDELAGGDPSQLARMCKRMVTADGRWQTLFAGQDPHAVFGTTKRQVGRYDVGEFKTVSATSGEVELCSSLWTDDPVHADVWSEFYRGRLAGILELTGHKGAVDLEKQFSGDGMRCHYAVRWE